MTKEEIISGLEFTVEMFLFDPSTGKKYIEPRNDMDNITIDACRGAIELLKQEPKTGRWITEVKSDLRGDMWPTNPKCSICGKEPYYSNTIYNYKFCPYCGAKMVELKESEDKEWIGCMRD